MEIKINIQKKSFLTPTGSPLDVLKNCNLSLHPHEFVTIVGPSGCGKSTLLRIIAGFDNKFNGEIAFLNSSSKETQNTSQSLKNKTESRLGRIGYIPQDFSLFPWLNVEKNIRFALDAKNFPREKQDPVITQLLELVNMASYRRYYPHEISGGMKQKIAICRAIATNPSSNFIVMDEPFSALDAQTRNTIQHELLRIWKEKRLTILFITHNIDEAVFLSDHVLVLSDKPAKIIHEEKISINHPRDRTSLEFNVIRRRLLGFL